MAGSKSLLDQFLTWHQNREDNSDSEVLDSIRLQKRHAVDQLSKSQDGTTVVTFQFATNDKAADTLCKNDRILQGKVDCAPVGKEVREAALAAMRAIGYESGAKIRFVEVPPGKEANIAFVERHGTNSDWAGYAGEAGKQPFVAFSFDYLSKAPDKLTTYGLSKAEMAKISQRVNFQSERNTAAHEIEHILGAKHANSADVTNPKRLTEHDPGFYRTIMDGGFGLHADKVLGPVDIAWYQRHFGKAEPVAQDEIKAPPIYPNKMDDPAKKR